MPLMVVGSVGDQIAHAGIFEFFRRGAAVAVATK